MAAPDFELLLFEELSLTLLHLEVEEAVRLASPRDGTNVDLRHLDFYVLGCGGGDAPEASSIFMRRLGGAPLVHFALARVAGSHSVSIKLFSELNSELNRKEMVSSIK